MRLKYKSIIEAMSLEEKAALLSGKNYWETQELDKYNVPSIFLSDGPNGVRKQIKAANRLGLNPSLPATCFPSSSTLANSWDSSLLELVGKTIGEEAVSEKVNVLLGPGINIKRNPLCGRNFEYYSDDPLLSGKMAAAFIRGVQSNGISACVKHFACNNQEYRRLSIDTIVDERTLREIYLTPFEIAIKEGKPKTVMSAYNRVNGDYCNENMHLLTGILRKDWGFDGVVVTDWGSDNDRVKGLIAGNTLEMPSTGGETTREILAATRCGLISHDDLDLAVDRLLALVYDTDRVYRRKRKPFSTSAHHEIAKKAAEESIVLLKNKGHVLPLSSKQRIAIVGDFAREPRYQGAGSAIVHPTKLDSTIDCIAGRSLDFIGFARGYKRYGKNSMRLVREATDLAREADIVIAYIGLDEVTEGEGFDRTDLNIPENQITLLNSLIETGKKIVVVFCGGAVVELPFADKVDAIVDAHLSGQAGAAAILNVLTGEINPSGKLAETYPISYKDVPSSKHFADNEKTVEYREGLFIGYRYYLTAGVKVRYPFGFGLSYTTFDYSNLSADDSGAYFTITNTGHVPGMEIAQLYIGKKGSKIFRPVKELRGFTKVMLNPGESKRLGFIFDENTFRYFNVLTNCWEIEPGTYQIYIAASSEDIRLSCDLKQVGTVDLNPYDSGKLSDYYMGNAINIPASEFEELLRHPLPNPGQDFVKKNTIDVDYTTVVADLRYSRGWVGRLFAWSIRLAIWSMRHLGRRQNANTLVFGIQNQPMRSLSRMSAGAISWKQLDGLILMFNGHFWLGFAKFLKEGHRKKVIAKAERITFLDDEERRQAIIRQHDEYSAFVHRSDQEGDDLSHEA